MLVIALAVFPAGCGERGTQRIRVTGQVTFEGKPLPFGNITFEPDTAKGNRGPQGYARIQDGKYDTDLAGSGPNPGAQSVFIEGYPELGTSADNRSTRLVCSYRTTVDLPHEDAKKDFNVPATSARRVSAPDPNLPPP